jgi:tetratricopeptide (TPR) repeat protein
VRHARLAMEHDNRNPMGYIQYGNSQFYMPAVFGGSKKEAIVYFQKAQDLMEQDGDIKHDWNYLSLLTLIAQSFEEMKEHDRAKEYYEKILEIEPQFLWVKNELYPEFLQKMKGNE